MEKVPNAKFVNPDLDKMWVTFVRQGRWFQFTIAIVGHEQTNGWYVGVARRDKKDKQNRQVAERLALLHAIEGLSGFEGLIVA
jgi:hypothetical protein